MALSRFTGPHSGVCSGTSSRVVYTFRNVLVRCAVWKIDKCGLFNTLGRFKCHCNSKLPFCFTKGKGWTWKLLYFSQLDWLKRWRSKLYGFGYIRSGNRVAVNRVILTLGSLSRLLPAPPDSYPFLFPTSQPYAIFPSFLLPPIPPFFTLPVFPHRLLSLISFPFLTRRLTGVPRIWRINKKSS